MRIPLAFAAALSMVLAACAPSAAPAGASPVATTAAAPTGAALPTAEQPRPGGELVYIVTAEPPTFDGHQSTTFATLMPVSPHYSLLYRLDPADNVSKIVPDVADGMPQISADKLTWTVKLRKDVKFHDGSALTAEDVVATYEKIRKPPTGVTSPRQATLAPVESVTAQGADTVVFKLKYPSASFQAALASPWNYLYQASKLKTDPKYYEKNVMGTGPFTYTEYVKGSHWAGKKNPGYFVQGKPYLDSYKAVFITDVNRQTTAIQSKQAMIEFRGFTPTQRDTLSRALPNDLAIQEAPWVCVNYVSFNTTKKPFDDARVRRALTMAIDRWKGGEALSRQTIVKDVGGLMRPKGPFAMTDAELEKIPGFARDNAKSVEDAKKLLADAGASNLTFNFLNRNVTTPYEPVALFVINEWKKIGVNATHQVKETAPYQADLRNKNFDVGLDFNCDYFDEPDLQLAKFYSASGLGAGLNLSHYEDKKLDGMIDAQSRETDPQKRKQLVGEIERYAMGEQAWMVPVIWWYRIIPHLNAVRGYRIGSNHYTNMDMANVWLATSR
ncbi:MAG: ABC transporter substrate-binding protein [Chloroflexi bacterium]|nr:ABC transporter substrate-binding protein [Chloroflexota bacterium]